MRLTHALAKRNALHPILVQKNIQEAVAKLVQQKSTDHEALLSIWKSLPKEDRKVSRVVHVMAKGLFAVGKQDLAKELIEESLDQEWDPALADIYPDCVVTGQNALLQIQKVESWMMKYPSELALSLALARICVSQKLWGKAKSTLQGLIHDAKAKPVMKADAHMCLAQLFEALEQPVEAAEQYKFAATIYTAL